MGVKPIAGHSGSYQASDVLEMLGGCVNVWVDISFQSPEKIRELIKIFDHGRVLNVFGWSRGERK